MTWISPLCSTPTLFHRWQIPKPASALATTRRLRDSKDWLFWLYSVIGIESSVERREQAVVRRCGSYGQWWVKCPTQELSYGELLCWWGEHGRQRREIPSKGFCQKRTVDHNWKVTGRQTTQIAPKHTKYHSIRCVQRLWACNVGPAKKVPIRNALDAHVAKFFGSNAAEDRMSKNL